MSQTAPGTITEAERQEAVDALMTDGIIGRKGAFSAEFVQRMREDVEAAFDEARSREGGAVGRGPNRYYVEIHPEQLRGFVELVGPPVGPRRLRGGARPRLPDRRGGLRRAVPRRDEPAVAPGLPDAGRETRDEHRLTSLAFNLTLVDTEEDMGPFEIALGTQWDRGADFEHEMFPAKAQYGRYEERAVRKYPQVGDISARSALTIHRGTKQPFAEVAAGAGARRGRARCRQRRAPRPRGDQGLLGRAARSGCGDHLACPVVDELTPITQKHTIEGLVMGEA